MALKHSLLLVGVVALAPAALAIGLARQEGSASTSQEKPVAKPASAAKATAVEVSVPVTGLTKENSAKAQEALSGLTSRAYVCEPCKVTEAKPGTCSHCKAPLASKDVKPLERVSASADRGAVAFHVHGGARVSLSQVEGALQRSSLRVDRDKLVLQAPTELTITGAKDVAAVEKALEDSKLFATVQSGGDQDMGQVRVWVQPGATAPTLSSVSAALEKAQPGARIADVVWGTSLEKAS
jgi:hypothetical protein